MRNHHGWAGGVAETETIPSGTVEYIVQRFSNARFPLMWCSTDDTLLLLRCRREGKKRITVRAKPVRTSYYVSSYSPHSSERLKVFFYFFRSLDPSSGLGLDAHTISQGNPKEGRGKCPRLMMTGGLPERVVRRIYGVSSAHECGHGRGVINT